jgi:hypothetical protein
MAIVVDVVAIPYIGYITWDEYTGKPLGLRSPKAKIRLVLLDLFFIIFESANLSLAFGALTDENGACSSGANGYNFIICSRVKALCAILMVALIAWSLTFSTSIFRSVFFAICIWIWLTCIDWLNVWVAERNPIRSRQWRSNLGVNHSCVALHDWVEKETIY